MIHLPPTSSMISLEGEPCDPLPAPWDPSQAYKTITYYLPRPVCKGSWIRYFLNGKEIGVAFENLYYGMYRLCVLCALTRRQSIGKYHPAVSAYMGGTVRVNFGDQKFCIDRETLDKHGAKPMSECARQPAQQMEGVKVDASQEESADRNQT